MTDTPQTPIACPFCGGAMAPSISDQLSDQGIKAEPADLLHWQKDADAITRIAVRQILPESQAHNARRRLMKRIAKELVKKP